MAWRSGPARPTARRRRSAPCQLPIPCSTLQNVPSTCRKSIMSIGFIRNGRRRIGLASVLALSLAVAACGSDDDDAGAEASTRASGDTAATSPSVGSTTGSAGTTEHTDEGDAATLRLGYFPNVTHAPAIIG